MPLIRLHQTVVAQADSEPTIKDVMNLLVTAHEELKTIGSVNERLLCVQIAKMFG
jgi:hypothetical protein